MFPSSSSSAGLWSLIDRDCLRKISWDIWIDSFEDGELIGDQLRGRVREGQRTVRWGGRTDLQWEDSDEGGEWAVGRDDDRVWINSIGEGRGVSDDIDTCTSGLHLCEEDGESRERERERETERERVRETETGQERDQTSSAAVLMRPAWSSSRMMAITGVAPFFPSFPSIKAKGPCFKAPPLNPSAWM
jgi:hypothetical protein